MPVTATVIVRLTVQADLKVSGGSSGSRAGRISGAFHPVTAWPVRANLFLFCRFFYGEGGGRIAGVVVP